MISYTLCDNGKVLHPRGTHKVRKKNGRTLIGKTKLLVIGPIMRNKTNKCLYKNVNLL
jgi:hypothetical protein